MISNFKIEDICHEVKLPIIGVFSKDELPSQRKAGSYYINLENIDDGNGTHWVFFRIFESGKALYFDSFGIPMPQEVAIFLSIFKPVATNNRQIQAQDVHSQKCGWFCLALDYFLTYDHRSQDPFEEFDDFLNMWFYQTKLSDICDLQKQNKCREVAA